MFIFTAVPTITNMKHLDLFYRQMTASVSHLKIMKPFNLAIDGYGNDYVPSDHLV